MKKFFIPTIEIQNLKSSDIIATSADFQLIDDEVSADETLGRLTDWTDF